MGCVPEDIDLSEIRKHILKNKCVQKIEDLHVWVLGDEKNVLTCHIKLHPSCSKIESQIERVNEWVNKFIEKKHDNICHVTL